MFEKLVASQKLDSLSTKAHLDVFENPHTAHTMERALAHTRAHSRADHGGEAVVRGVRDCGEIGLMTGGSLHTYTCAHLSTLGLSLHTLTIVHILLWDWRSLLIRFLHQS